jgi:7,8-dihydropterin-6-yl-methyl-4-(beta-D-ribofuranosyl)aminobenzene 5'-phosphate synthase
MIIKSLVDNTSVSNRFECEHGLSIYIEMKKYKLLFDLGASALLIDNAEKMGVDLSKIDLAVISHGHNDHGGGLKAFLNINSKAKIYVNQKAFDKHYTNRIDGEKAYIGLDKSLSTNDRLIFAGDHLAIDDELELFSDIKDKRSDHWSNQCLFMESGTSLAKDDFTHEQNLVIREREKTFLFTGCAHNGIVNMIGNMIDIKRISLTHVIGGFHLYSYQTERCEDPAVVGQIGKYLMKTGLMYYTCHCTGIGPYKKLKESMGKKIQYLATGSQLKI